MSDIQYASRLIDQAAYNLECSLERQRLFMDDWLQRFESALDQHAAKIAHPVVALEPAPISEENPEVIPTPEELAAANRKYTVPSPEFPCVECQTTQNPGDYGCGKSNCPHDNTPF